jgi:hypothetical protein
LAFYGDFQNADCFKKAIQKIMPVPLENHREIPGKFSVQIAMFYRAF